MNIRITIALSAALLLAACASKPRAQQEETPASSAPRYVAYFAPAATPRFVTIERDPTYALVRDDARDLVAFRAISVADGRPTGASITCFINIPADAPLDTPLHLAEDDSGAQGWAIVETSTVDRRVAPLEGAVILLARADNQRTLAVDLAVTDDPRVPSIHGAAHASLTPRREALPTPSLTTRSGVAHAAPPPKPDRRKTDAVWPWAEIMGDYPPPTPTYAGRPAPPAPNRN